MNAHKVNLLPINEALAESLSKALGRKRDKTNLATAAFALAEHAKFEESRHAYFEVCRQILSGERTALPVVSDFGYVPGDHVRWCDDCGTQFPGAVAATTCSTCAEKQLARSVLPWVVFPNE